MLNSLQPALKGEFVALVVAFLWASASMVYTIVGRKIPAPELNLFKNALAIVLCVIALSLMGLITTIPQGNGVIFLLLSGAIGIGVGDTAYFEALQSIGPRKASLLKTLAPPSAGLIAMLALSEFLSPESWIGTLITVAGVAWVITERTKNGNGIEQQDRSAAIRGIAAGVFAALSEAVGVVLSRAALTQTTITPLWATLLRLIGGLIAVLIVLAIRRQPIGRWMKTEGAGKTALITSGAVFMATFLGIWLQQIALQLTEAGIVQTIIATSPLFILGYSAIFKEKITIRAILGALVALAGIAILFLS